MAPNTPTFNPSSGTSGTYSYTGTGCSVNAAGTLTPLIADDSCVVTLTATTTQSNYDTGTTQFTVNVIKSDQDAPGSSDVYGGSPSLVTGGTLSVNAAPNGGHGTLTYQTTTADKCQVTPGGGETPGGVITALLNGPCTIQAKWGGDDSYNPSAWGTVQTIQIGLGTLSITAPGSYTGPLVVGNATGLTPSTPTTNPTGADLVYALKQGETDCTLDGTTGDSHGKVIAANVAIDSGVTACTVVLTASKSGYNPATAELEVNLQGAALVFETVAPPAYPYPGFATDGGIEVGDLPGTDDNNISVTWSFVAVGSQSDGTAKSSVCTVDNSSSSATFGDVTADTAASAGDLCTITITATTATLGYESWSQDVVLEMGFMAVVQISMGLDASACALFEGGKAKCWGYNESGQLGVGDLLTRGDDDNEMGASLPFVDLGSGLTAKQIAVAASHSCAILNNDGLKCWGGHYQGELGIGANALGSKFASPSTLSTLSLGSERTALQVATGYFHTCVLLDDKSIKCWGRNNSGQLGYGDNSNRYAPEATATVNLGESKTAKQVVAGEQFTCAILNDDTVKCWGSDARGQLGDGQSGGSQNEPHASNTVNLGQGAKFLAASWEYVCAILNDNSLKCWGINDYGQLGRGGGNSATPQSVSLGQNTTVVDVAMGRQHTCVILNDNTVKCWGRNNSGQLGYGNTTNTNTPPSATVDLGQGRTARSLSMGWFHSCALLDDYTVKCWGQHSLGSLGTGSGADYLGDGVDENGQAASEMGDNLPVVDLF